MSDDDSFTQFYFSCQTDNIQQLNKICSQSDVGFVSIDSQVIRHQLNAEGMTDYQVVKDDEIRQLFHRSLAGQLD